MWAYVGIHFEFFYLFCRYTSQRRYSAHGVFCKSSTKEEQTAVYRGISRGRNRSSMSVFAMFSLRTNRLYNTHVSLCVSALSRCSSLAWRTDDSGAHFTRTSELLLRTRTSRGHGTRPAKTSDSGGGGGGDRRVGGRGRDSYTQLWWWTRHVQYAVIVCSIVGVSVFPNRSPCVFTWFKWVRPEYHPDSGGSMQRDAAGKYPLERPLILDPRLWSDKLSFHFWYYSPDSAVISSIETFFFFCSYTITPKKTILFSFRFLTFYVFTYGT